MKSTIDLLNLQYALSQNSPLSSNKFLEAIEQRVLGSELRYMHWERLEELHRIGVLIPMFRVEKNSRTLLHEARRSKVPATSAWLGRDISFAVNLFGENGIGKLEDPQFEPYRTWYSYMRSYKADYLYPPESTEERMHTYWASSFFYSPYQLLLVPKLRNLLSQMRMSRRHAKHPNMWKFRLKLDQNQQTEVIIEAEENRDLLIALTALEAKYLPKLRGHRFSAVYSGMDSFVEALMAYQESFDPIAMLDWIGWDVDKVKNTAEKLLFQADKIDPLRDWYELVRMCHPDMLNKLRGDALIALDHRRAAEMLLRFYEDLQAYNAAPPFAVVPKYVRGPHDTRFKYDLGTLDDVLMKFGLSPQPSLVLVIEGDTEEYVISEAMKLLDIPQYPSFIQVFNAKGINKKYELLARYIVPPQLGDSLENAVLLTRPPTHFLVAVDAENKFSDPDKLEDIRKTWVDGIYSAIPEEYHTDDMRNDLDYFVHIETWEDVFEFGHFTNAELAQALLVKHKGSEKPLLDVLITKVDRMRRQDGNKDIKKILKDWNYQKKQENPNYLSGREVGKMELAIELWPVLENKIREASAHDLKQIPIVRILLEAEKIAGLTHRKDVIIRY